jgi:hypothetical protein
VPAIWYARARSGCRRRRDGSPPRAYRGDEPVDPDSILQGLELTPKALFDALVMG